MCRSPCLFFVKRKRIAFGGYSTDVKHIFPTLYAFAPLRSAAILLSGCSFRVFLNRELSPDLHLFLLPIRLRERVPTTPTHKTGTFIQDIPELTVNLRSARTLILPTYRLSAATPSMAASVHRYRHGYSEASRGTNSPEVITTHHSLTMPISLFSAAS